MEIKTKVFDMLRRTQFLPVVAMVLIMIAMPVMPVKAYTGMDDAAFVDTSADASMVEELLVKNSAGGDKMDVKEGQRGSQSFTYGKDGDPDYHITKIVLNLSREEDAPDGDFEFNIGTAPNADTLSGSAVGIHPSQIVDQSGGSSFMTYEVKFGTPVGPLSSGAEYFLNFESNAPNGKTYYLEFSGDNYYDDGTYYKEFSDEKKDAWFEVWGTTDANAETFNLDTSVTGQGNVDIDPAGGTYRSGTMVQLTAQPATGWVFDHWEGNATGSANPATVVMDSDKTVTAVFVEAVTYSLGTTTSGQGTVSLDPVGGKYTADTVVTLTAQPATGWVFDHWEGNATGSANPATVVMDSDKTVTAVFVEAVTYSLGTTTNGQGTVSLNPPGGRYTVDTVVTLKANPADGWAFAGWSGALSGTQNPATVTMDGNKTVEAMFTEATTDTWKFIIYGDTRSDDSAHRSVLRSIVQNTPDHRFIINVGDVVGTGSSTSQWNTWQRAVDDILGGSGQNQVPPKYMSAIGNHDTSGMTNWRNFLPGQNQQFGNGGRFFTFDYANARFVVLNSEESLSGAQLTMLRKAINENPKTWLFTVWHRPIFPFGAKSYEGNIHQTWGKPLNDGGGDIMFMGHAHYYVRTGKIGLDGTSKPPMDAQNGTVQVVTGMGGAPPYSVSPNADGYGYMAESWNNKYGYTELTVTGSTLTLKQILDDGTVIDSATYQANLKRSVSAALFDDHDAALYSAPLSKQTETPVEPEPGVVDAEEDEALEVE